MVCQYTNTSSWCVLLSNFWFNSLCEDYEFSDLVHKSQSCQPPVRERDPLSSLMESPSSCLMAWSHSRLWHQIASSSLSSLQHRWADARKENLITMLNPNYSVSQSPTSVTLCCVFFSKWFYPLISLQWHKTLLCHFSQRCLTLLNDILKARGYHLPVLYQQLISHSKHCQCSALAFQSPFLYSSCLHSPERSLSTVDDWLWPEIWGPKSCSITCNCYSTVTITFLTWMDQTFLAGSSP